MNQVSDVLRAAMVDAERRGISLYRIAKECELDDSIVYRFYHDECGLALSSVDRLARFLKLELVPQSSDRSAAIAQAGRAPKKKRARRASPPERKPAAVKKQAAKKVAKKSGKKAVKRTAKKKSRR